MSDEHPLTPKVRAALHTVLDPEIKRPITDLGKIGRASCRERVCWIV